MPINPYFKDYSEDQNLVEDLTVEIIKTMGRDVYYIPRENWNSSIQTDVLFGEQRGIFYDVAVPIEMYLDSNTGFPGQGDIASKFGIEIKDDIYLTVAKKRFIQEIQTRLPLLTRPREGDLIFFPLAKALFEINFVEHENPFYQIGKLYSYRLTCQLYNYNEEEFNTGNTDIDGAEKDIRGLTAENNEISTLDNDILDFTETDPFSEGNY
jgi:hypothetical protein